MEHKIKNWILGVTITVLFSICVWLVNTGFDALMQSNRNIYEKQNGIELKVNGIVVDMAVLKDRKAAEEQRISDSKRNFARIRLFQMEQRKENNKVHNNHETRIVRIETQCEFK